MKIDAIVKKGTCIGCGTCAGVCHAEAIDMNINDRGFYFPKIDLKKCTDCELCYNVCPQTNEDNNFDKLNEFVFGKNQHDILLGNYISCYTGYSTDETLRYNSSSGGTVTQLLISALEDGIIDGALVTRMKRNKPLEPEPFIARTKDEIISAMGSKYCPVPANIMLKEIINGNGKFAVVGLPCHIQGIRKAEMLNSELRDKIVLHFGLLCSAMKSFFGTEYILEQIKLEKDNVENIKYRGDGWPGCLQITEHNKKYTLNLLDLLYYGGLYPFFVNPLCIHCSDFTAELSDISCGDAWNLANDDEKGTSLLICRTNNGRDLLNKNISNDNIKLKNINRNLVVYSTPLICSKKKLLRTKISHNIRNKLLSTITWFSTHPNKPIRKYSCLSLYLLIKTKSKIFILLCNKK